MAVIPSWLNVNPSDFVKAMQMGASAGLEVAGLRQRGNLASAQLAQNAADREAAREESAARAAESIAFRRWEEEQQGRRAAAALAQQGQIAQAGVNQRGLAAVLRSRDEQAKQAAIAGRNQRLDATSAARMELDKSKLEESMRHSKAMEQNAADKLKKELGLPDKLKLYKSGSDVISVDPVTGESKIVYTPPEKSTLRFSNVLVDPKDKDSGRASALATDPWMRGRLGTNAPPALSIPGAPVREEVDLLDPLGILK